MALLHSFETMASLSTAKEVTLGDIETQLAYAAVLCKVQHARRLRMCEAYTVFTAEQRAASGKYASEPGNTTEVKKFKADLKVVS